MTNRCNLERRNRVIEFIRNYVNEHEYAPSLREIAEGVELKGVSSVHFYMERLLMDGVLETDIEGEGLKPRAYRLAKEYR